MIPGNNHNSSLILTHTRFCDVLNVLLFSRLYNVELVQDMDSDAQEELARLLETTSEAVQELTEKLVLVD